MTRMKRMVLAAASATLIACALSPASAAPVGQAGVAAANTAAAQSDSNVTQVGRRWHRRRHGWYGHRHHYRRRGGVSLFIAAPIVVGPPAYYHDDDYDDYRPAPSPGLSCYKQCRQEHGPDYCRDYWRRYCRD